MYTSIQPSCHIFGLFCTFSGPLGLFFGPLGLFLESGSGSKTFLKPTYVVNQLWFYFGQIWGLFGPLGVIFGFGVRFENFFGTLLFRQSTLVVEVQPYLFFEWATFWASFALFWALWGYFLALLGFSWG